jgi:hypothetical protein
VLGGVVWIDRRIVNRMSLKLTALALVDLALAGVLLAATDSTAGTVTGLVLLVAGVAVGVIGLVRRPRASAEQGLRRADADAARDQATSKATKDRVEDGGYQTGGQ